MKYIYIIMLILAAGFSSAAQAQDDLAQRLEAARAYEKTSPVSDMVDNMLAEMAKNPQFGLSQEDAAVARESINKQELQEYVVQKMAAHFTAEELQALAAFYGSPQGRTIMAKFPAYMSEVMPYIQMAGVNAAMAALMKKQIMSGTPPATPAPDATNPGN